MSLELVRIRDGLLIHASLERNENGTADPGRAGKPNRIPFRSEKFIYLSGGRIHCNVVTLPGFEPGVVRGRHPRSEHALHNTRSIA